MPKVEVVTTDVVLKFEELTDDIFKIIGEEVINLRGAIKDKGQDVYKTGWFKTNVMASREVKRGSWQIQLKADYSSILWSGRRKVGNRYYGSENWAGGGEPMLRKMENKIVRRTDNVSK